MTKASFVKPLQNHSQLNTMSARVDYIRVILNYPPNQFGRLIGSRTDTVESICSGKSDPTITFLKNILSALPVSEQFLYMGGDRDGAFIGSIDYHIYNPEIGLTKNKEYSDADYVSRFKFIRSKTELSQAQFAISVGVSRDIVSAIENGRQTAPLYLVRVLHSRYNINLNWLISGTGTPYLHVSEEEEKKRKAIAKLKEQLSKLESEG